MDDELINICSDIWDGIENEDCPSISFVNSITGCRFRYQSEIDKKSFSVIKAEKNNPPIVEVVSTANNAVLVIELVILEEDKVHFNMLYDVSKEKNETNVKIGKVFYDLKESGQHSIKLDSLGIKKMKNKEAQNIIRELYPKLNDHEAKLFYNRHKDAVRFRVMLYQHDLPAALKFSDPIKSQTSNEQKSITIKHISPKVVAESGEQLIVVLQKKITTDQFEAFIDCEGILHKLSPIDQDGQTFIFNLPTIECASPVDAKFIMKCCDNKDSKPIRFLASIVESRKRKADNQISSIYPIKRLTNNENRENIENARPLYPESGQFMDDIQTDSAMEIDMDNHNIANNDYESLKDSGFDSNSKSDEDSSDEEDEYDTRSESGNEFIEIEGFGRKNGVKSSPDIIKVSPKKRHDHSHLDIDVSNSATRKILSEVARIGHDFAFGKSANDVFERFEKQLPVVFTLQDDVGDTPLNNAILKGNVDNAFKILCTVKTHCKWALDLVNTSGHSALILAPACDVPAKFIAELLNAGCRLDMWDDTGKSAIVYAIEYQNVQALEVLLKYVKEKRMRRVLSRFETAYYSPLQLAVLNDFKDGIRMLLELKDDDGNYLVDVNEMGLMNKETALLMAVSRSCQPEILELLLTREDININQLSFDGQTALHISNIKKSEEISKILRSHHAVDVLTTSDVEDSDEEEDNLISDVDMVHTGENQSPDTEEIHEKVPVLEELPLQTGGINNLTYSMNELTLMGVRKKKVIDLLITSEGPTLGISELKQIVNPYFKVLFTKYGNTDEHKRDVSEMLDRLNCLPSSLGQLVEDLESIGRSDLVAKIRGRLEVLSNC